MTHLRYSVFLFAALILHLSAQTPLSESIVNEDVTKLFRDHLAEAIKKHKGDPMYFIRKGVVADRNTRTVTVLSVAAGLGKDAPTEFGLVAMNGKDHETLAVTLAKPSDIHAALEFIRAWPGHPVRPSQLFLWPRGDRLDIEMEWEKDGKTHSVPLEQMLWDNRAKSTLKYSGWMFAGSWKEELDGKEKFLADEVGDVIATFNSPWTVIDVPMVAGQTEVYGSIVPNEKYLLKMRTPVKFVIKPQLPLGESRIVDFDLFIKPGPDGKAESASDLRITLINKTEGTSIAKDADFKTMLSKLRPFVDKKLDIYLSYHLNDSLTQGPIAEFFQVMKPVNDRGIMMVEPTPNEMYYESFLPNPAWADSEKRPQQPIEIFFPQTEDGKMLFRYFDEVFGDGGSYALEKKLMNFSSPAGLAKIIGMKEEWITRTVLIYVQPDTPYKKIKRWYSLIEEDFPIVYIFPDTRETNPTIKKDGQ